MQRAHPRRQPLLRTGLLVAHQQQPDPPGLHQQDDAGVVGRRLRVGWGRAGGRQHLPAQRSDPGPLPHGRDPHRHTRPRRQPAHLGRPARRLGQPGHLDRPHPAATEHTGQAVDVVGVEVREHHQRHPSYAQPPQAPVDQGRVGTGVDHHRRAVTGVEHQPVALTHVAGHQHPPAWRPPRRRQRHQHQHQQQDRGADRPAPSGQQRPEHQRQPAADQGQHQQRHRTGRPAHRCRRQRRRPVRDRDHPVGAPGGRGADRPPERHPDRGQQATAETEHGRRGHRRRGEQVGHDRDQAHLARDRGHHRRARELRRQRDGQCLGRPPGQPPAQRVTPARRQEHDPRRRQHRQREPDLPGQPRVEQHQHQHREPERAWPALPTVAAHADQRHGAHHRRPQHARLRAGQQHEPDHPQGTDHDQPAGPDTDRPREHQQRADDQRQVGAGHGQQVGQAGRAEVGRRPFRQADVVTVDQRRHQCARLGRPVGHRLPDALAHVRGTAQQRSVARQHLGLAVREVDRAEVVAVGRRQAPGRPHRLAEVQRAPPGRRDHEHRLVQPPGQPTCCDPGRGRPHQDVAREPSLPHRRVARELEPNLGGDLLRGEPRQRTGTDHLDPEQCTARHHHGDQQPDHELGRHASPATPPRQDQRATGDDQGAVQPRREVQPSQRGQPGDHTQRRCPQVGSWCVRRVRVLELVVLVTVHLLTTSRAVRCRRASCPRCRPPRAARRRT